jgi:hypothetical protein
MSKTIKDIAIAIGCLILLGTIFYLLPRHGEVVYNCSIAEISPDIPVKVKEECRKLRKTNYI